MLYTIGFDGILLGCIKLEEANTTLHEIYGGICGSHSSGPTLAKKFLRTCYYFSTIEQDA